MVTRVYKGLRAVTGGNIELRGVERSFQGIHRFTAGFMGLQGATRG